MGKRNPYNKMPAARSGTGLIKDTRWGRRQMENTTPMLKGRYISGYGYVQLTRRGMTDDDIKSWPKVMGCFVESASCLNEHQLVAVKKYGRYLHILLLGI